MSRSTVQAQRSGKKYCLTIITLAFVSAISFFGYRTALIKNSPLNSDKGRQRVLSTAKLIWSAYDFTPIADCDNVARILENCISSATRYGDAAPLTAKCLGLAGEELTLFLAGYASSSYEDYLKFRLPINKYVCSVDRVNGVKDFLSKLGKLTTANQNTSSEELYRLAWQADVGYGKELVIGMAAKTAKVAFSHNSRLPNERDLTTLLPFCPMVGHVSYFPFFKFPGQPAPENITAGIILDTPIYGVKDDPDILTMTFACVLRIRAPDSPVPVAFKAYWSNTYNRWLPMGIAVGCMTGRRWDFLF